VLAGLEVAEALGEYIERFADPARSPGLDAERSSSFRIGSSLASPRSLDHAGEREQWHPVISMRRVVLLDTRLHGIRRKITEILIVADADRLRPLLASGSDARPQPQ
jgi:hypothetical protein